MNTYKSFIFVFSLFAASQINAMAYNVATGQPKDISSFSSNTQTLLKRGKTVDGYSMTPPANVNRGAGNQGNQGGNPPAAVIPPAAGLPANVLAAIQADPAGTAAAVQEALANTKLNTGGMANATVAGFLAATP